MKKNLTLLLALLMLAPAAVSCAEDEGTASEETTAEQTVPAADVESEPEPEETEEEAPDFPEMNCEGYTFTFLNGNTGYAYCDIVPDEETGDVVYDTLFRRNVKIEEQYNLRFHEVSSSDIKQEALQLVLAGDNGFDIALMQCEWALQLVLENAAADYADLPFVDTSRPWWNQNALETMSINGKTYFGLNEFDITHFETVRTIFFNQSMIEQYDLPSLYTLVAEGKWTLDRMKEYGTAVASDLNGNGSWDDSDQYAFTAWGNVGAPALMIGVGAPLTLSKDENDFPYFSMDTEYYYDRLTAVTEMLFCQEGFLDPYYDDFRFNNGAALFYINNIAKAVSMREMEDTFGFLTMPKYSEEQEEYFNYGGSPFYMVIPPNAPDFMRTGVIMESLGYESYNVVGNAYYDVLLQGKLTRNEDSVAMLDLIFSSLMYQNPTSQSFVQSNLVDLYIWKNKMDFASYFEGKKKKIQTEIDKVIESYQNLG